MVFNSEGFAEAAQGPAALPKGLCVLSGIRGPLGEAIAAMLLHEGVSVWGCSRRLDGDVCEKLEALAGEFGASLRWAQVDLADTSAIEASLMLAVEEMGSPKYIVNNVGKSYSGLLVSSSMGEIKELFDVNFFAPLAIIQFLLPSMIRKGEGGSIVNIGSIAGKRPARGLIAYGGSKAALAYMGQSLAKETAQFGIRVNTVAPSLVDSTMMASMREAERESMLRECPLKRPAFVGEVASAVRFLLSTDSSYINGTTIEIDGGI